MKFLTIVGLTAFPIPPAASVQAVTFGQMEDFQNGPGGWTAHSWISTGGPAGEGDAYVAVWSGAWPSVLSIGHREWNGDYLAGGVTAIEADLINLGETDLNIRFKFLGYGAGTVTTSAFLLAPGEGWRHVRFELSDITPNPLEALRVVTTISFVHKTGLEDVNGTPVIGSFGIDNIRLPPEPASLGLFLVTGVLLNRRQAAKRP